MSKTQAVSINIVPPPWYIHATPSESPRNTDQLQDSSMGTQEVSYHVLQKNPEIKITPTV